LASRFHCSIRSGLPMNDRTSVISSSRSPRSSSKGVSELDFMRRTPFVSSVAYSIKYSGQKFDELTIFASKYHRVENRVVPLLQIFTDFFDGAEQSEHLSHLIGDEPRCLLSTGLGMHPGDFFAQISESLPRERVVIEVASLYSHL